MSKHSSCVNMCNLMIMHSTNNWIQLYYFIIGKSESIEISCAKVWPFIYDLCLWLPCACLLCLGQNNTQSVLSPLDCSLSCGSSCHLSTSQPTTDLATLPCHVHTYILQTHPMVLIREDNEHTLTKISAPQSAAKTTPKNYTHQRDEMCGMLHSLDIHKWHMFHLGLSRISEKEYIWIMPPNHPD